MGVQCQCQWSHPTVTKRKEDNRMRYSWTPSCSLTAMKYQRYGYVHPRPFLPGERKRAFNEMEKNTRGFKEVRKDLLDARECLARQEYQRRSLARPVISSFYKSPVGCRSYKGPGGIFWSEPRAREGFFSGTKTFL